VYYLGKGFKVPSNSHSSVLCSSHLFYVDSSLSFSILGSGKNFCSPPYFRSRSGCNAYIVIFEVTMSQLQCVKITLKISLTFVLQAKFLPHTGDCHIVTCARDGQVRLAQLSTTGTCKATKRLAAHKMAAHKVYCD